MNRKPEIEALNMKRAEFDPSRNYGWEADAKFVVSGTEIDTLNKVLNIQTLDQMSQYKKFIALQEGLKVMFNILKDAYDDGIVKLVEPATDIPQAKQVPASETATGEPDVNPSKPAGNVSTEMQVVKDEVLEGQDG